MTEESTTTSSIGYNTDTYKDGKGVYLSPFTYTADTTEGRYDFTSPTINALGTEDDATLQISGSIGSVVYHDRTAGVAKGELRTVDSSYIVSESGAYGVYNTLKTAYDNAVKTYNTEKDAYEKDTSKDKPDMPQTFGAYAGP